MRDFFCWTKIWCFVLFFSLSVFCRFSCLSLFPFGWCSVGRDWSLIGVMCCGLFGHMQTYAEISSAWISCCPTYIRTHKSRHLCRVEIGHVNMVFHASPIPLAVTILYKQLHLKPEQTCQAIDNFDINLFKLLEINTLKHCLSPSPCSLLGEPSTLLIFTGLPKALTFLTSRDLPVLFHPPAIPVTTHVP